MITLIFEFILLGITWATILSSKPYDLLIDWIKIKIFKKSYDFESTLSKAFKCALCSGTWVGALYAIITLSNPLLIGLTAIVAELTFRKINTF